MSRKKRQVNVSLVTLLEQEQRNRSAKKERGDGKPKRENVIKRVLSLLV